MGRMVHSPAGSRDKHIFESPGKSCKRQRRGYVLILWMLSSLEAWTVTRSGPEKRTTRPGGIESWREVYGTAGAQDQRPLGWQGTLTRRAQE